MTTHSRRSRLAVIGASAFLACADPTSAPTPATHVLRAVSRTARPSAGVYVQTNSSSANEVIVYGYDRDGSLVEVSRAGTGGQGLGGGSLVSQGSVAVVESSQDRKWLFVTNVGSNNVSVFRVDAAGLTLTDVEPSGGLMPVSVAVHDGLVFVLNAGVPNNVMGFRLQSDGNLVPMPNSMRALSGRDTKPTQVAFSPDGNLLVVSEQATATITTFLVRSTGLLSAPQPQPLGTAAVYSVVFDGTSRLIAAVGLGAAPDGAVNTIAWAEGRLGAVGAPVLTGLAAPIGGIALTSDGLFVFASAPGSGSVVTYTYQVTGTSHLVLTPTGDGSRPVDLAVSADSRMLYVLTPGAGTIQSFGIETDGRLTFLSAASGIPKTASGLVVR